MNVLLNTSFFFVPQIGPELRRALAERWVPACASCGVGEPVCLAMEPEEGIERMAIQTLFADREAASRFLDEVIAPVAASLVGAFGAESFTCFSTIMEVIDL